MWNKIKEFFSLKEDEYYADVPEIPMRGENIIAINRKGESQTELSVMHPTSFSDALLVMRFLKNRSAVLVNITKMSEDEAQRLIDFVSGSAFALDGHQERVGEGIFLITPSNIFIRSEKSMYLSHGMIGRG